MSIDNPPPLDYRPAGAPQPQGDPVPHGFLIGLGSGAAVSFVAWWVGWSSLEHLKSPAPLLIVPIVKVVAAIAFIASRRSRALGAGVLTSIPLGALIFVGSCFAHFHL